MKVTLYVQYALPLLKDRVASSPGVEAILENYIQRFVNMVERP
jgi:hypothetical protein